MLQAIQYLQKLCNHPALVLTKAHPEYPRLTEQLERNKSSIHDIEHAPKIAALKQLLTDCGIGSEHSVHNNKNDYKIWLIIV